MLDYVYISFIALSLCCGLVCTRRSSHSSYKLLLIFLFVTLFNEAFCYVLKHHKQNTHFYYNLYYYFRFPFLGYIFQRLYSGNKTITIVIKTFYILTIPLFLLCLYLYHGITKLHSIYLVGGGLFIVVLCLLHFYNLLKKDDIHNPFKAPFFWIATGLFFYFLGVIPFLGIINFLVKTDLILAAHQLIIAKTLSIL